MTERPPPANAAPASAALATPARVFVIDDHPMIVEAVRLVLSQTPDLCCAGAATGAPEAVEMLSSVDVDVVLLDLSLSEGDGLDLLHQLHRIRPSLRVLVFSMHPDHVMAERALAAGARGYLMKDARLDEMLAALRTVAAGEVYVRAEIMQTLRRHHAALVHLGALTPRELNVLYILGTEPHVGRLAERLCMSRKTAETHLRHIREKLGLADTAALRAEAQRLIARA